MDEVCFSMNFRYGGYNDTDLFLPFNIAKMEFLLLVAFKGVCEDTEGASSCFGRRENGRRITSSFHSFCESVHS
jgi:hypothetical protein